jgi:hypothetical protein
MTFGVAEYYAAYSSYSWREAIPYFNPIVCCPVNLRSFFAAQYRSPGYAW